MEINNHLIIALGDVAGKAVDQFQKELQDYMPDPDQRRFQPIRTLTLDPQADTSQWHNYLIANIKANQTISAHIGGIFHIVADLTTAGVPVAVVNLAKLLLTDPMIDMLQHMYCNETDPWSGQHGYSCGITLYITGTDLSPLDANFRANRPAGLAICTFAENPVPSIAEQLINHIFCTPKGTVFKDTAFHTVVPQFSPTPRLTYHIASRLILETVASLLADEPAAPLGTDEELGIDDRHLTFNGVTIEGKKYSDIAENCHAITHRWNYSDARNCWKHPLQGLAQDCEAYYNNETHWLTKRYNDREIDFMAKDIIRNIEEKLTAATPNAIARTEALQNMRLHLEARIHEFEGRLQQTENQTLKDELRENIKAFDRCNILQRRKAGRLYDKHQDLLAANYETRTLTLANRFAIKLLQSIIDESLSLADREVYRHKHLDHLSHQAAEAVETTRMPEHQATVDSTLAALQQNRSLMDTLTTNIDNQYELPDLIASLNSAVENLCR